MEREVIRRRNLPHWDVPGAAYFVTTCLAGSIPAQGLLDIDAYRIHLESQQRSDNTPLAEWKTICWKKTFVRIDSWLDARPARRDLERPELANIVVNAIRHFADDRYDLFSFVVMPSHFHWLFQPRTQWIETLEETDKQTPRQRITHSINRYTSLTCNKILRTEGEYWQHESYDHWVRDIDELERIMRYIEENPASRPAW